MAGLSRETQDSIAATSMFPGFKFSPTDVELISYYLKNKTEGFEKCVEVIAEIEFTKHEPWDLPAKSIIQSENEWFFFCARGRKYPNGSQSRRATELGYWKATGKERNVKSGNEVIGTKRTLVFHVGRAPKGERTEWIMHEYCMEGRSQDSLVICRLKKNSDFRLNNTSNYAVPEGGTEQIDSASESEQKLAATQNKDFDGEDDFFADILKDDIIKLDEVSLFATSVVDSNLNPEALRTSQQHVEAVPLQSVPLQGTASRRIKLKTRKPGVSRFFEHSGERTKPRNSDPQPLKCVLTLGGRTVHSGVVSAVFCILILLAVFLYLCGGFWPVKAFSYALL